jgi:hypothetical protein
MTDMATDKEIIVEVVDESRDDDRNSSARKIYNRANDEFKVAAKATAIYFEKLTDLMDASNAKRRYGALEDLVSNASRAHKAALRYVTEHSENYKDSERQAKKFLPDSAIEDFHSWLNESDDDD